jgi:hypothetical protein
VLVAPSLPEQGGVRRREAYGALTTTESAQTALK